MFPNHFIYTQVLSLTTVVQASICSATLIYRRLWLFNIHGEPSEPAMLSVVEPGARTDSTTVAWHRPQMSPPTTLPLKPASSPVRSVCLINIFLLIYIYIEIYTKLVLLFQLEQVLGFCDWFIYTPNEFQSCKMYTNDYHGTLEHALDDACFRQVGHSLNCTS